MRVPAETEQPEESEVAAPKPFCELDYKPDVDEVKAMGKAYFKSVCAASLIWGVICGALFCAMSALALMDSKLGAGAVAALCAAVFTFSMLLCNAPVYKRYRLELVQCERQQNEGGRVVLFTDWMTVRIDGDDRRILYSDIRSVKERFGCVVVDYGGAEMSRARRVFCMPVSACEENPDFMPMLLKMKESPAECGELCEEELSGESDHGLREVNLSKGRELIGVRYKGMSVSVRRSYGVTELIVDGTVYGEKRGVVEFKYEISSRVNGVRFAVAQQSSGRMLLYANGRLLREIVRVF